MEYLNKSEKYSWSWDHEAFVVATSPHAEKIVGNKFYPTAEEARDNIHIDDKHLNVYRIIVKVEKKPIE